MPPRWSDLFGHASPYDDQIDGIETAIDTAQQGGFTVIEGACGTGKTMLALTAGLDLVRDPESQYERVVVLTSVKQQLRQFEADLETINEALPEDYRPCSGLTLVGKADVCPYNREGAGGIDDTNVYERCESLRDRTRELTGEGGATTAGALTAEARSQQIGIADSAGTGGRYLETADEPSPYPPEMPEYDDTEFCPFYAQYLEALPEDGDPVEAVPFDVSHAGLIQPEDLVRNSVEHGTCPHSMMGAILGSTEVVIGNYYHAFDPTTVSSFTGELLEESTFVICDEAHMLEPRVRDLVSDSVADTTLRDAESELTRVLQELQAGDPQRAAGARSNQQGSETAELIRAELADSDVSHQELETTRGFIRDLREEVDRIVAAHLDREQPGWKADLSELPDDEIPLRDPETPAPDQLTEWAADSAYDGGVWVRAEAVGAIVSRILDELEDEQRQRAIPGVGKTLHAWYRNDHERYFREIDLERTWNSMEPDGSWRRAYTASLAMQNCVPNDAIGERLGDFGGGVLMSATLEPMEIFSEVTGLSELEAAGRPVEERRYGLAFPAENRESFAVAAPKYTYDNRGPTPDRESALEELNQTRRSYIEAIAEVGRHSENVLVGMPNYNEAEWAASCLRNCLEKPVLLDQQSGDDETETLKTDFFAGDSKLLVTSLRGTLTEGVDYQGDRLSAAVVCGVPIVNTASPRTRAVRTAYDRTFGDGFTTALLVPAVRKARQAVGRVIRGPEERGVRVLLDERYARASWDSVRPLLPEREEFQPVSPDMLGLGLERFWDQ